MAIFGSPTSFIGIDIGTSALKLVELVSRRRRIELSTYAQAELTNPLIGSDDEQADASVGKVTEILKTMIEKAGVSADTAVAALPSSIVFSTVTSMPRISEKEMDKAVEFAARDLVPADLSEMVLGWSRLGEDPHMSTDGNNSSGKGTENEDIQTAKGLADQPVPVFLTAAPAKVVNRYMAVVKNLQLKLLALEVETFPLIRSLLSDARDVALIVDIGDLATTYHVVDAGTPRVSHTIDQGGRDITVALEKALGLSAAQAAEAKARFGLLSAAPDRQRTATEMEVKRQIDKATSLLKLYNRQQGQKIKRTILIGGGANLIGLSDYWTKQTSLPCTVGNPWKGLSYPLELDKKLRALGPTFGVAVGLALRGVKNY